MPRRPVCICFCLMDLVPWRACPRNARFSKMLCTFRDAGAARTDHSGMAPSLETIIVKDAVPTMKAMPMKTMTCQLKLCRSLWICASDLLHRGMLVIWCLLFAMCEIKQRAQPQWIACPTLARHKPASPTAHMHTCTHATGKRHLEETCARMVK